MTAQIGENLTIDGTEMVMCTEPLGTYFALGGLAPTFAYSCSALWRGYVGNWEIRASRLYLIGLSGTLKDGTEATLATVFPDYPERVFAHWYSGTLRIPQGKLLAYEHMGYGSTYERDRLIGITNGVVTSDSIRENGTSDRANGGEGYSIGGMTIFPFEKPAEPNE